MTRQRLRTYSRSWLPWGALACATLAGFAATGCKNIVRSNAMAGQAPRHAQDFSVVKFTSYHQDDRVLSSGAYKGLSTRAEVIDKAASDLKAGENCSTGSQRTFCTQNGSESVQWIQLFFPDGSSCGVGEIPQGVAIQPCMDKS
jgi:hypothetical protein